MRHLIQHKISLSIVVLAAAVAVPVVIALNPLASSQAANEATASPTLAGTVAAFKATRTAEDALPATLERVAVGRGEGINTSDSRKAQVTKEGVAIYLAPAEGNKVCLLADNASVAPCYSIEEVAKGAPAASDSCSAAIGTDTVEIGGIVPSDASDPVVILSNGTTKGLEVVNGTYLQGFPKTGPMPTGITWKSPSGTVTVSASVPSGAATEPCVVSPTEVEALAASGKIPAPLGHPPAQPTMTVESNQ